MDSIELDRLEDKLEETIEALQALGLSGVSILRKAAAFLEGREAL